MIKPEMVPDEVVEAAAKELAHTNGWRNQQGVEVCKPVVIDIIAAALNAWPGMDTIMLPRMVKPGHFAPQDYIRLPSRRSPMANEPDAEFVERMEHVTSWREIDDKSERDRLFALARRGAAMDTKPQTSSETVREDEPKGFMAGWLLGRADAAKVLDDMPCAPSQGIHDYWAGYRAALTYGAVHIRALPPPPAGEQE